MMPIPKKFLELILAFLEAKKVGNITLHVHEGNVLKVELSEFVKL